MPNLKFRELNNSRQLRIIQRAFAVHRRGYSPGEWKVPGLNGLQLLQHDRGRVEANFVGFRFRSIGKIGVNRSGRDQQVQRGNDSAVGRVEFGRQTLNGLVVGARIGDLRRAGAYGIELRTSQGYFCREIAGDRIVLIRQPLQIGDPYLLHVKMRFDSI